MNRSYKIVITEAAKLDLHRLEKYTVERIVKKLRYFEAIENPLDYAEPLKEPFRGMYRFRIGEYRVMFMVEPSGVITVLLVLHVGHRKDSYK